MDQISKTVNTFLSYIVGIGLICFFSFVFLLASARLNRSTLGNLLASSAGETARMARSESFSFWGDVGQQVASGLGVSSPLGFLTPLPIITPEAPATMAPPGPTAPPPADGPTQAPTATSPPIPTTYIRSSPLSEGGLLRWRGLEADGTLSPLGVSLESVRDQANLALSQNSGDLLALWLLKEWRNCEPYLGNMRANFADPAQVNVVRQGADDVRTKCNPRVYEAYARTRWADISAWVYSPDASRDEARVPALLAGLKVFVGAKVDGPARDNRPQDHVPVTFQSPGFGLPGDKTITVTIGTINEMLGNLSDQKWDFNSGPYTVAGVLFPANPPEPVLPTDADLTPPVVAPAPAPAEKLAQPSVQGTPGVSGAPTTPGKYVVAAGDTVYAISRKFNVSVDALIAANPNTLGFNPNYITPGMELNIPTTP
jgi:LysM repeat protein